METLEKVLVEYDEMFCDEISIKLLYQHKNKIEGFVDENNNQVSKSAVADWIMENYYNDRKFVGYCKEGKGKILETAEQVLPQMCIHTLSWKMHREKWRGLKGLKKCAK